MSKYVIATKTDLKALNLDVERERQSLDGSSVVIEIADDDKTYDDSPYYQVLTHDEALRTLNDEASMDMWHKKEPEIVAPVLQSAPSETTQQEERIDDAKNL